MSKAYLIINGKMVEEECTATSVSQCKRHYKWHSIQSKLRFSNIEIQKEIFDTTGYEDGIRKAKTQFLPPNYRRYTVKFNGKYWKQHDALAEELANKLTEGEKASLKYYAGTMGYQDVMNYIYNRPRRVHSGFTDSKGNHTAIMAMKDLNDTDYNLFMKKVVDDLNKVTGLARELETPQIVYRAMVVHDDEKQIRSAIDEEEVKKFIDKNFKVGDVFYRKAITSTSEDPAVSTEFFLTNGNKSSGNGVIIEYKTRKGARISRTHGTGGTIASELEVLIPAETKFRVVSINHNVKYTIDARENGLQRGITPNRWGKIVSPKITLIQVEDIDE